MSEIWVTSDQHFSHNNIIHYCQRPFKNVNEMKEKMIKIWNDHVSNNDYVLHLGDFILGRNKDISKINAKEIIQRLNGTKYLIIGNHDRFPKNFYRENGIPVMRFFYDGDYLFTHHPLNKSKNEKPFLAVEKFAKENNCKFIIHGHSHNIGENLPNHFNVCADKHNFAPVNLKYIEQYFEGNK